MMILISTGEACFLSPFDMKLTYRCVCVCVCDQELTEEGKPFLLLFYHPDNMSVVETFRKQVALQLLDMKSM